MKKLIPLRIQKVIMFIPFFNTFVLFIWLYNYSRIPNNAKIFIKSLLEVFAIVIPIGILQTLLINIFSGYETVENIFNFIMIYSIPLVSDHVLIKYQEKTIFKK